MFNEHPEAGTPEALDDSENAGTPDATDGSESDGAEIKPVDGKLAMTWKAKAERVNELEGEVTRLRAEREQRTTTDNRGSEAAPPSDALEVRERELAEEKANLAWLKSLGDNGDQAAKAVYLSQRASLRSAEDTLQSEFRVRYLLEMSEIPKDKRAEVEALVKKTPGLRSPALAYRFMKGDEHETQAQEIVRLKKELEDAKTPRPAVDRQIRGASKAASVAPGVKVITLADYNERMAADPHTTIAERKAGKFKIEG